MPYLFGKYTLLIKYEISIKLQILSVNHGSLRNTQRTDIQY